MKTFSFLILLFSLSLTSVSCQAQAGGRNASHEPMNTTHPLTSLHDSTKSLSVQLLFKGAEGATRSLQIQKGGILPEHLTLTEALLLCVSGEALFEDEKGTSLILHPGDFYRIRPQVKHWVKGMEDSQLLLIK